jgi:hypothetical protein
MSLVSREASSVRAGFFFLDGSSVQPTERIKTSELQTTVIARQFMQTGNPQDNQRIVVATLNSGTFASRTPHGIGNLINLVVSEKEKFPEAGKATAVWGSKPRNPEQNSTKPAERVFSGLAGNNPGGFLLSHAVARAVPSAPRGLTSVFGMGTGVTLSTQPPENRIIFHFKFQI